MDDIFVARKASTINIASTTAITAEMCVNRFTAEKEASPAHVSE